MKKYQFILLAGTVLLLSACKEKEIVNKKGIIQDKEISKKAVSEVKNKKMIKKIVSKNEMNKEVESTSSLNKNSFTKAPIYPGCENQAKISNEEAMNCLTRKLSFDISNQLQDFANNVALNDSTGLISSKLIFTIDENGNFTNISSEGDKNLGEASINVLKRINNRQQRSNTLIIPALDDKNNKVAVKYNIPIKMQIQ